MASQPTHEATPASAPAGVHLVGSVPLASAEQVFRRSAAALGDRLRRMPDGETGERSDWIAWQYPVFASLPQFERSSDEASYRSLRPLELRGGVPVEVMSFGELGYARAAIESYEVFDRLKRAGAVPPHCRFLVSLPTPLAPVSAFVAARDQARIEPRYEARMLAELRRLIAAIPADQLAIQWDARYEFAMLEGAFAVWFPDVFAGIVERLLRLGRQVPAGVELGYHLCYGDDDAGHFAEPRDSGRLVEVANELGAGLERSLDWVHLPVPRDRDDDAYFEPLADLRLAPGAELYLGLLHASDGEEGARRRIAAARRHVDGFGVGTECGWGRGGAGAVAGLLALHRAVSSPLAAAAAASP